MAPPTDWKNNIIVKFTVPTNGKYTSLKRNYIADKPQCNDTSENKPKISQDPYRRQLGWNTKILVVASEDGTNTHMRVVVAHKRIVIAHTQISV